ncbi:MAG: HAMP domain-containing sensor histidine kinase, partial [Planctomycetota bacterium]
EIGWIVDVIDNGPGVSAEDRAKIFSLFESNKGARGTGLGLPVSAKILKEHGGTIEILDRPDGNGCCFRVTLPAK